MTTSRLMNIVRFVDVTPGVHALPHGLNIDGVAVTPDFVVPGANASFFAFASDATNVTVTNHTSGDASVDVYVISWHSLLRVFGSVATTSLTPFPFIADQTDGLAADIQQGNTVLVDAVFGNDATGVREGAPFLTVAAGLAAAQAGDAVIVRPGTYDLSAGITIPPSVTLLGSSNTVIRMLAVTTATTLITMGENSRVEALTFHLTSAQHVDLIGIDFPGTTAATATARGCTLTVDNASAGAGTSVVTGVRSNGTGIATTPIDNLHEFTITVASIGNGAKRGVLCAGANTFRLSVSHVNVTGTGGGTFIAVETNHASAVVTVTAGVLDGSGADISQTLGILGVQGGTILRNVNANGRGFTVLFAPTVMTFGDPGAVTNGVRYFYPGTEQTSTSPVFVRTPAAVLVKSLSVRAAIAPGGSTTCIVTIQKNGVDTALTVTLTGAQVFNFSDTISVGYAAGDDISVKVNDSGATTDVICVAELY